MTVAAQRPAEHIGYRRSAAIPGLEILDADHSAREWRAIGNDYAVTFLRTWRGTVRYRGRMSAVERGIAFCNYPGEALIATPEANHAGSFKVLAIRAELMQEWSSEHLVSTKRPEWRGIFSSIPDELGAKFQWLSGSLTPDSSALQLQSHAVELAEALVRSLVAGACDPAPGAAPAIRGTARMRECLNEEGFDVDLETLAREAGMSKFQALRAFKRRYGLPPHRYQVCLRIAAVQHLLLRGAAQAEVAAQCGFVDQSHMIRHFKRIVGVTPMRYLASNTHAGMFEAARSASAIIQRSDRSRS